jgi:hypothetical protein
VGVNRRKLRVFLIVALLVTAVFAAWTWFRPYAWNPDPAARCAVKGAHVRQDHSYFWLDLHLKVSPGQSHDLMKPVRLVTAKGREIEAADVTLAGKKETGTTDMWFKFWLEAADLEGPLSLRINDGSLSIKSRSGMPALGSSKEEFFPNNQW